MIDFLISCVGAVVQVPVFTLVIIAFAFFGLTILIKRFFIF